MSSRSINLVEPDSQDELYRDLRWGIRKINTEPLWKAIEDDNMRFMDSWVLRSYVRAWRMWNTWLIATERQEIEIEEFIKLGFQLVDRDDGSRYLAPSSSDHGKVIGRDGLYDVEISRDQIYISFKGKPRYTWHPCVPQMGNLKHEEDQDCRFCERSWLQPESADQSL